jgi:cytochrome c-type biogenesis protein CcmE
MTQVLRRKEGEADFRMQEYECMRFEYTDTAVVESIDYSGNGPQLCVTDDSVVIVGGLDSRMELVTATVIPEEFANFIEYTDARYTAIDGTVSEIT